MVKLTDQEARAALNYWQKILRLQDWDVNLIILDKAKFFGQCRVHGEVPGKYKWATIWILDPEKITASMASRAPAAGDWEVTLVHELLHIYTAGFDRSHTADSPEDLAAELMVERLAQALVRLERQNAQKAA